MKGKYPKRTENQHAGTLELLYQQKDWRTMKGKYPKRAENQNAWTLELLCKQSIEEIWTDNILREQRTEMLEP